MWFKTIDDIATSGSAIPTPLVRLYETGNLYLVVCRGRKSENDNNMRPLLKRHQRIEKCISLKQSPRKRHQESSLHTPMYMIHINYSKLVNFASYA